jgi:hypothetical protein
MPVISFLFLFLLLFLTMMVLLLLIVPNRCVVDLWSWKVAQFKENVMGNTMMMSDLMN